MKAIVDVENELGILQYHDNTGVKLTETLRSQEEGRWQEQSGNVSDTLEDGNQMTKQLGQSWSQSCSRSGRNQTRREAIGSRGILNIKAGGRNAVGAIRFKA